MEHVYKSCNINYLVLLPPFKLTFVNLKHNNQWSWTYCISLLQFSVWKDNEWMLVGGNEPFDNSSWKGNMLSWMCKGFVQAFDQE